MSQSRLLGFLLLLPLLGYVGVPQAAWFACGVLMVSTAATLSRPSIENIVFLLALTLRLLAEAAIPHLGLPSGYLSDVRHFDAVSRILGQAATSHSLIPTIQAILPREGSALILYAGELALWHGAAGSLASFGVVNILFCATAAAVYAALGRTLFGAPSAWASGLLAAALPSAVLYGGMPLRDSQSQLFVATFLFLAVQGIQTKSIRMGVVSIGVLLLALSVRWYLGLFALAAAGTWLLLSYQQLTPAKVAIRLISAVFVVVLLASAADHYPITNTLPQAAADFRTRIIQKNAELRPDNKLGSALFQDAKIPSFTSFLTQLPGMATTVGFSPLPGGYDKPGFATKAAQIENVLLLGLLLLALPGAIAALTSPSARIPFLWFLACFFAYGLVEPDMGSAIRHKAQFWPAIAIYAPMAWLFITKNKNKGLPA